MAVSQVLKRIYCQCRNCGQQVARTDTHKARRFRERVCIAPKFPQKRRIAGLRSGQIPFERTRKAINAQPRQVYISNEDICAFCTKICFNNAVNASIKKYIIKIITFVICKL